jgi:hypothetical protein
LSGDRAHLADPTSVDHYPAQIDHTPLNKKQALTPAVLH